MLSTEKQEDLIGVDVLRRLGQDTEEKINLTSDQKVPRSSRGGCNKFLSKSSSTKKSDYLSSELLSGDLYVRVQKESGAELSPQPLQGKKQVNSKQSKDSRNECVTGCAVEMQSGQSRFGVPSRSRPTTEAIGGVSMRLPTEPRLA